MEGGFGLTPLMGAVGTKPAGGSVDPRRDALVGRGVGSTGNSIRRKFRFYEFDFRKFQELLLKQFCLEV